jgi:predicted nucleic acid-binding Zn ribbon protein
MTVKRSNICRRCGQRFDWLRPTASQRGRLRLDCTACKVAMQKEKDKKKDSNRQNRRRKPLHPLQCARCGVTLFTAYGRQRFCSVKCRLNKAGIARACASCGATFVAKWERKNCDACVHRSRVASAYKSHAKQRAAWEIGRALRTRACAQCGVTFVPRSHKSVAQRLGLVTWGKYCSTKCARLGANAARRLPPDVKRERRRLQEARRTAARRALKPPTFCATCGAPLPKRRLRFCSQKCWPEHSGYSKRKPRQHTRCAYCDGPITRGPSHRRYCCDRHRTYDSTHHIKLGIKKQCSAFRELGSSAIPLELVEAHRAIRKLRRLLNREIAS